MPDSEAKPRVPTAALSAFGPFLKRWLRPALLAGAIVAILVLASGFFGEAGFTAETALLLTAPQDGLANVNAVTPPQVDASVYRTAVLEGGILGSVLQQLGEPSGQAAETALARRVNVTFDRQLISSVIRIRVTAAEPERAALLANLIAEQVLQWDLDRAVQTLQGGARALQATVAATSDQLAAATVSGDAQSVATLEARLEQVQAESRLADERISDLVAVPLVRILSQAELPPGADGPRLTLALLVFLAGTTLVLVGAWLAMVLGNSLQHVRDVEAVAGLPVLTAFPQLAHRTAPERRDAADKLRDRLFQGDALLRPVVVLVTSPTEAAEKEGVALALAESFGRSGLQTLLLDANLRQPTSGSAFHLDESEFVSLEQFLTEADLRLEFVSIRLEGRRVFSLIPSFTPASWPAELLRTSLGQLLRQWQRLFQVIVIDSAPLLPFADTGGIAGLADVVVLGTKLGETQPEALRRSIATIRQLQGASPALVTSAAGPVAAMPGRRAAGSTATRDYAISILRAPRENRAEPSRIKEDDIEMPAAATPRSTRPLS